MAISTGSAREGEPMDGMNTTPLIDVMLVMLIMIIWTIPLQTHAVKIDLPIGGPQIDRPNPLKNKIVITASGQITWNTKPVSELQLRQYLDLTTNMDPVPELHLQPEANARYEQVDRVLAITKHAKITAMGFVGNEYYAKAF